MEGEREVTNRAAAQGIISAEPVLSHAIYGEEFYSFYIEVPRLSGTADVLPATASLRTLPPLMRPGACVRLEGQLRSYNRIESGANRLDLRLFAQEMALCSEQGFANEIELTGYICKPTQYRLTPFGREITDILLAVNRRYGKSDYVPCIAWGRNARAADAFEVGERIRICGRLQSREYEKELPGGERICRTTYEVSAGSVRRAPEDA